MSKKYVAMIIIEDKEEEFTVSELKEIITENMLEYAENAPFMVHGLKIVPYEL